MAMRRVNRNKHLKSSSLLVCLVFVVCSWFSKKINLPLTVPDTSLIQLVRVSVVRCWFISRQYTTRNTCSVTHSTDCMQSFLNVSKVKIERKKKLLGIFEEWYLHDLRSPTRMIEKMKWIYVCYDTAIRYQPLLLSIAVDSKYFHSMSFKNAIVHYVQRLCWTTSEPLFVEWMFAVCLVFRHTSFFSLMTNRGDSYSLAIVELIYRCFFDKSDAWIYECVN